MSSMRLRPAPTSSLSFLHSHSVLDISDRTCSESWTNVRMFALFTFAESCTSEMICTREFMSRDMKVTGHVCTSQGMSVKSMLHFRSTLARKMAQMAPLLLTRNRGERSEIDVSAPDGYKLSIVKWGDPERCGPNREWQIKR